MKITEITFIIIFVILTIPVWQSFDKKLSKGDVVTSDMLNLEISVKNTEEKDYLTINNKT